MQKTKDKQSVKTEFSSISSLEFAASPMLAHADINRDRSAGSGSQKSVGVVEQRDITQRVAQVRANYFDLLAGSDEAEKKRIARELHDGLGQLLTSINLHALQCLNTPEATLEIPPAVKESLHAISCMTKLAMSEMRGICSALRPAILDDLGVEAAVSWQCRQIARADGDLKVTTDFAIHEAMIPEDYKTAIYRIAQEALNNAVKYSAAQNLSIKLYHAGDYLQLLIEDDGVGFDTVLACESGGMGLTSMRERCSAIGGLFELRSGPGRGVEIRVLLPLEKVALSG